MIIQMREDAGNIAGAQALYRQYAEPDGPFELLNLGAPQEAAGDTADAERMRRFGLTGTGEVATTLDFGSYGGLLRA
jgi:hypothetical protein